MIEVVLVRWCENLVLIYWILGIDRWQIGTGLYIVGLIAYQGALTFWTAAFVGLARDLPESKVEEEKMRKGEIG